MYPLQYLQKSKLNQKQILTHMRKKHPARCGLVDTRLHRTHCWIVKLQPFGLSQASVDQFAKLCWTLLGSMMWGRRLCHCLRVQRSSHRRMKLTRIDWIFSLQMWWCSLEFRKCWLCTRKECGGGSHEYIRYAQLGECLLSFQELLCG